MIAIHMLSEALVHRHGRGGERDVEIMYTFTFFLINIISIVFAVIVIVRIVDEVKARLLHLDRVLVQGAGLKDTLFILLLQRVQALIIAPRSSIFALRYEEG